MITKKFSLPSKAPSLEGKEITFLEDLHLVTKKILMESVHGSNTCFNRSSPSPNKTFDECRGASPELNSYNNLK
jgi:hypothetical protein